MNENLKQYNDLMFFRFELVDDDERNGEFVFISIFCNKSYESSGFLK